MTVNYGQSENREFVFGLKLPKNLIYLNFYFYFDFSSLVYLIIMIWNKGKEK